MIAAGWKNASKRELNEILSDYGLPRAGSVRQIVDRGAAALPVLDTGKGKFRVAVEPAKSEMEVKRELDFLLFLRKHGFPCEVPLADRRGRHYRDWDGGALAIYRYTEGHFIDPDRVTVAQLEDVGRVLAELHLIGKTYKKGIDNRFGLERVSEVYGEARGKLPQYFKRIIRTLDEEFEYLGHYLEAKLPKGIIHGRLGPDSIKFKGDKVVAVLEFEPATRGKFIFDLANVVNGLCFERGRYILKKFEALLSGYEALRSLSLAEWDAFPNELRFSAFRLTVTRLRDFFLHPEDRERINKDFQDFYERLRILRREREGGMEPMLMAMATGYDYRKYQRVKALEKRSGR